MGGAMPCDVNSMLASSGTKSSAPLPHSWHVGFKLSASASTVCASFFNQPVGRAAMGFRWHRCQARPSTPDGEGSSYRITRFFDLEARVEQPA